MRLRDLVTGSVGISLCGVMMLACGGANDAPIEPPQALSDSTPFVYPVELWDEKISGETILLLRISELGEVDSVVVSTPSGFREFDSAAVQGARNMKFTPGKQGDRRVPMWTKLPVRFARDTTQMGLGEE